MNIVVFSCINFKPTSIKYISLNKHGSTHKKFMLKMISTHFSWHLKTLSDTF